jgi:hypothetical protein
MQMIAAKVGFSLYKTADFVKAELELWSLFDLTGGQAS